MCGRSTRFARAGRPSLREKSRIMVWTEEEIELLRRLRKKGASATRAAVALKRAKNHVRTKARELGIPFETVRATRKSQRRKEREARTEAGLPPEQDDVR